ncbi:alpha/beta hydrolase family protein [Rhizorhabdus phycosphaerae]|uniref:alpha/beta hydrolase family protein n=1 Tax=Rhizorhabdus phycosphaerae TaxID=2711156 RepID=UPI0013ED1831|nr:S9 family peptidase [Rhizorhabdus phycosphaerae]
MIVFSWFARFAAAFVMLLSVAVAAAPPIDVYGKLPTLEMTAMSPSGDRIALIGMFQGKRQLLVTDGNRKLLTAVEVGDYKLRAIHWAGDETLLMHATSTYALGFGFTTDKTELSSMVVVNLGKGAPWTIFQKDDRITGGIRGYFGAIERDGRWYGYFGGITLQRTGYDFTLGSTKAELYEVDLETRKSRLISNRSPSVSTWRDWVVNADGSLAAYLDFEETKGDWTLYNGQRRSIATGRSPLGDISLLSLGRTPGTVLYFDRDAEGRGTVFEIPLAGGAAVELLPDEATDRLLTDDKSRLTIGYTRDGDVQEDHFFDERHEKRMAGARRAFPGATVRLIDANAAFDRMIVRTDGPGDPQSYWVVDIKTGRADPLGSSYAINPGDVGPMRMIRYKAADGLEIGAVLTLPPGRGEKNLPLIVLPHGGPAARDYPVFDWWAQAYASRGYAVLQPNFRGSEGLGPAFRLAGYGEWGRKMQSDISDGVADLARQGIIDPKRVCIVGASYGGYAALAGVTLQQGLYRCAVSVAGVADVSRMISTDIRESGQSRTVIRSLRTEIGSGRDMKLVSPANFAERADAPIMLIHGVDDIVVPFDQSRQMASALSRAGKPHEFIRLEGEDHWLSKGETRLAMLKASIAFVEKHNPPDPAPAAKP